MIKKWLIWLLKILVTVIAFYFVFQKISYSKTVELVSAISFYLFIPAFLLFNLSKWVSAIRLQQFYKSIDLLISFKENLRLYYIGMFYNQFLPGGIGGDGYKVYLLNKIISIPVKKIVWATLLDRISGLIALVFLALISLIFLPSLLSQLHINSYLVIGTLVFLLLVYWVVTKLFFPDYISVIPLTFIQSIGVQISQVICILVLAYALKIDSDWIPYIFLFLISSIASALPFTIGGAGSRELVFVFASQYLDINLEKAVSITLLFFIISFVSALPGAWIKPKKTILSK
ncbi:MAG: flippase-like domain-containing protein [Bacteroidia bacterium]|nr:flippase-like domain-containing protein [Bacteroidia bacterium]MCF8448203.1 flippase-like domain-containing protein [Bacteroidia bacterium]